MRNKVTSLQMSNRQTHNITASSADDTEKLGEKIGQQLQGGEVIELNSDLGGGKTTFVRGLARGAGSEDGVSSPTFTIKNVYSAPRFEIWHFDFYRLDEAGMVGFELEDALGDKKVVTVIEWAKDAGKQLPPERLIIKFVPSVDDSRKLTLMCPNNLGYLVKDL